MTRKAKKPPPLSQRAYARRRGVTVEAVSKAIAERRLDKSLIDVNGVMKIADAELANREWEANTVMRVESADRAADRTEYYASRTRREAAEAQLREIELARHRGELIPVKDFDAYLERIEQRMKATFTRCRDRMLALPSRARQRDPSLSARQMTLIEALVRDILVELAAGDATANEATADEAASGAVEDARAS